MKSGKSALANTVLDVRQDRGQAVGAQRNKEPVKNTQ